MADDRKNRGPEDGWSISLLQPWEVTYWTKALGVSKERLIELIQVHGRKAARIRSVLEAERATAPPPADPPES